MEATALLYILHQLLIRPSQAIVSYMKPLLSDFFFIITTKLNMTMGHWFQSRFRAWFQSCCTRCQTETAPLRESWVRHRKPDFKAVVLVSDRQKLCKLDQTSESWKQLPVLQFLIFDWLRPTVYSVNTHAMSVCGRHWWVSLEPCFFALCFFFPVTFTTLKKFVWFVSQALNWV